MTDTALTVSEPSPAQLMARASDVAGACKEIVTRTAQQIGPRKYVRVEGWQAIAIAHGCVASSRDVQRTETGFRAIGEVRRMDTGAIIATAEGFVGDDEKTWASRSEFARRAMAQTRAISRACRSAFAHVVVLLNAGLETTPAEEMDGADHEPRPSPPAPRQAAPPERPPQRPIGIGLTVDVLRVSEKQGTNPKTGKPYTRYGVQVASGDSDPMWLNTFDHESAEFAKIALKENRPVFVEYETTPKGLSLVSISSEGD